VEAAALAMWEHTGATALLIDADFEHSALMLVRVRPATPLPAGDDRVAIDVAADPLTDFIEPEPRRSRSRPSTKPTGRWGTRRAIMRPTRVTAHGAVAQLGRLVLMLCWLLVL
jgi:hypothetical protein